MGALGTVSEIAASKTWLIPAINITAEQTRQGTNQRTGHTRTG